MATMVEYVEYVCEQIKNIGEVRYKKMFGEYMVYVNDKPVILVCNNNTFIKKLECIREIMEEAETGLPYSGAKEHYILDIDDKELCNIVIKKVEEVTPFPKPRKNKNK